MDTMASPQDQATYHSPLLAFPGAVNATGIDAGTAWHYGDPIGEQRAAERGAILVDRSNRSVLTVTGPDRLTWLHTLTSQFLTHADRRRGHPGAGAVARRATSNTTSSSPTSAR